MDAKEDGDREGLEGGHAKLRWRALSRQVQEMSRCVLVGPALATSVGCQSDACPVGRILNNGQKERDFFFYLN